MQRVWPTEVYRADIDWQQPISYDDALSMTYDQEEHAYFYKVLGRHGGKYSLFYIGKVFKQRVSIRLKNLDHREKRKVWQKAHPKTSLMVSIGNLYSDHFDSATAKQQPIMVDDLESLLIYSHSYHVKLKNSKNIGSHHIRSEYHLTNKGFIDEGMLKEIHFGMFYR